jgi:potassium-transporting ATPase potassium-binding subunit
VLILGGAVQNLSAGTDVTTLAGGSQAITGGPLPATR